MRGVKYCSERLIRLNHLGLQTDDRVCTGAVCERLLQIATTQGVIYGIAYCHCGLLQQADSYGDSFQPHNVTEDARWAD